MWPLLTDNNILSYELEGSCKIKKNEKKSEIKECYILCYYSFLSPILYSKISLPVMWKYLLTND